MPPGWTRLRCRRWRRRNLKHPMEGALAWAVYLVLRPLPLDWVSALGGAAGRLAGTLARGAGRRAAANLADPIGAAGDPGRTVRAYWDHVGRTIAEFAVIDRLLAAGRVELAGLANGTVHRDAGRPILFLSGHVGNWEIASAVAVQQGFPAQIIYRPPANRFLDRLMRRQRGRCRVGVLPKTAAGARTALRALAGGRPLGLLIDEKTTHGGVPVPTLGRPLPGDGAAVRQVARLAVAAGAAVVPFRVERLGGARFRLTLYPAIDPPRTSDRAADMEAIVAAADSCLAAWIRERPEQWLWLSQRLSGRGGGGV